MSHSYDVIEPLLSKLDVIVEYSFLSPMVQKYKKKLR